MLTVIKLGKLDEIRSHDEVYQLFHLIKPQSKELQKSDSTTKALAIFCSVRDSHMSSLIPSLTHTRTSSLSFSLSLTHTRAHTHAHIIAGHRHQCENHSRFHLV